MISETNTLRRRYPGVQPFKAEQKDLFFGREADIKEMLRLIEQEKLLVLFGKSGYGKSSLLNAGVVPRLEAILKRKTVIPIFIRQRSYVAGESTLPIDNVKNELAAKFSTTTTQEGSNGEGGSFYEQMFAGKTLWHDFKRRQTFPLNDENPQVFVLIFDQFEEFFLYPLEQQLQFKKQIAELLYTEIPQSVFHELGKITDPQQREHVVTPLDVRAIFAIREDRLGFLDSMKAEMPAILNKRYQLRGLMDEQAREAIIEPARLVGNFASPPFEYSETAVSTLITKLGETKQTSRIGIEAFQVQILCEYLESEIMAGHILENRIEPEHFANKINEIYEGYYNRQLDKLDPSVEKAAQELIEDSLIFTDDATGESRRLSVDADVLIQRYEKSGITYDLLRVLENNFLLRREPNSTGGYNYEVTHDTLIAPIAKSKSARRRELERVADLQRAEQAEKARQETEARIAEETYRRKEAEALREEAEKQTQMARTAQKRIGRILLATIIIALLAVAVGAYAISKRNIAKESLDKMVKAENEKNQVRVNQLLAEAKTYRDADEMELALKTLNDLLFIDPTHAEALQLKSALQR